MSETRGAWHDGGPGVSFVDGCLRGIDAGGLPTRCLPGLPDLPSAPTVLVHGYSYDPRLETRDNPHRSTFPEWRAGFVHDPAAIGFGWYSAPRGRRLPASLWRAWRAGRWNTYRHAWDLAHEAGLELGELLVAGGHATDVVAHSLGTRVVLTAIWHAWPAETLRNVVLINGAEYASFARPVAERARSTRFYNFAVGTDDVLNKLGRFAPGLGGGFVGNRGLGPGAPFNWIDYRLDDPDVIAWGRRQDFDLAGDRPGRIADHWYSFEHRGNWPLLRAALSGAAPRPPAAD